MDPNLIGRVAALTCARAGQAAVDSAMALPVGVGAMAGLR